MYIEVKHLSKEYKRRGKPFFAVNNASFRADDGTLVCITGESGSGKSTLLSMIGGLLLPTQGEVGINDKQVANQDQVANEQYLNETVGIVMQGDNLLMNLTILENICLPQLFSSTQKTVYDEGRKNLFRVGLAGFEDAYPQELSGGEQKRVELARALVNRPHILLADEPTGNLDVDNAERIRAILKEEKSKGTIIIVSTHDLEFVPIADTLFHMKLGNLEKRSVQELYTHQKSGA